MRPEAIAQRCRSAETAAGRDRREAFFAELERLVTERAERRRRTAVGF